MAVSTAVGTITLTTGAIGTTFLVSGLSFQPKAVILVWSGRTTAGQAEADLIHGIGFFTSTSSRRAYTAVSDHGVGTAVTSHMWRDDACVATHTVGGTTVGGLADVDQINSDGFRLVIDDVFPANLLVGWLAIGGSDVTDVAIVDFTSPSSAGNQDISAGFALDTGLDDKLVVILGAADLGANTPNIDHAKLMMGMAAGNSIAQAVSAWGSTDAAGTSQTFSYLKTGEVLVGIDAPDAFSIRASVTAWLSTGFRLNYAETSGGVSFSALVIKGGRYEIGNLTTSTGTTNQVEATAYVPVGLLLMSHNNSESTSDTAQAHSQGAVGAAVDASNRWAAGWMDKDGANTMDIGTAFHTDAMYSNQSTANAIVIEGLMDLVSFDASPVGFTWVMDDADPVGSLVSYAVIASAPAPKKKTILPALQARRRFNLVP